MENDRTFPSASSSEGSSNVRSRYWPDLNVQFDGFSNWNAGVRSATSCLLKSLAIVTSEAVVVGISSPSRIYLPESAFQQVGGERCCFCDVLRRFHPDSTCVTSRRCFPESGCDPATSFWFGKSLLERASRLGPLSAVRSQPARRICPLAQFRSSSLNSSRFMNVFWAPRTARSNSSILSWSAELSLFWVF